MMRRRTLLVAIAISAVVLISCGKERKLQPTGPEADRAIIAVVLEDFGKWKEATFGELEGVLELRPDSDANPDATPQEIKSLAAEIPGHLDDDVVEAFIERNKSAVPVTPLFSGSQWARPQQPSSDDSVMFGPPDGAKAVGSLTMPGISADGSRALVQIHHSWSMHGAVVTYVLSNKTGTWQVEARDQAVFL
jgi:hypothetical protein